MTVDDFPDAISQGSAPPPVLTITELNRLARKAIESTLPLLWVQGEISNFVRAASGHWYFSLKDDAAQVRCTFFRNKNHYLDWQPENGMLVEIRAVPSIYEARGDFQLNVELIRRAGLGALFEAFEKLKRKLELEGLFDARRKKSLPLFPRVLGIVTSPQAAALRDVLTALKRRMPGIKVVLYPAPVQGKTAGPQLADKLSQAVDRDECDALILCRGGGSIEDLWCFNDETLARTIAASRIPIVTGIGHETDFTIADFVADMRAPTPTAAAELISPDQEEEKLKLSHVCRLILRTMHHKLQELGQTQDRISRQLRHPAQLLNAQRDSIRQAANRLMKAFQYTNEHKQWIFRQVETQFLYKRPNLLEQHAKLDQLAGLARKTLHYQLERQESELQRLQMHLMHLNPQAVLERGYSITRGRGGKIIRDSSTLKRGELLDVRFARGMASVKVESAD